VSGKADGFDPRDDDPATYGFTDVPGDVDVLPGEFEPAERMLVGWAGQDSWEQKLVAAAAPHIAVDVVTSSDRVDEVRQSLLDAGMSAEQLARIEFITDATLGITTPLDSVWMRDFGPLAVRTTDGGQRIIDFRYYWGRFQDDALPTRLAQLWSVPVSRPRMELEGGNIQSNGRGTCVTTTRAVEQNEAAFTADEAYVKDTLRDYLGCRTTLIVPRLVGEGTGHVDMFVHLVDVDTALVGEYDAADDPTNADITDRAAETLADAGFDVTRIPMPSNADGVYRSYTNALAVNDAVMVPVYADAQTHEEAALDVYRLVYPDREIIPLRADDIIYSGGAIHCTTMSISR
jgi:agmatine deiminase